VIAMIGPVQLLVVGFQEPDFRGEVLDRLRSLREQDVVRVIDILLVYKDPAGTLETRQISDLSEQEAQELGAIAGALIGLGVAAGGDGSDGGAGADGGEAGEGGGAAVAAEDAARLWAAEAALAEDDLVDVLSEIPPDTAVAIALLEHRWAIPLRQAIIGAGGFPILDTWVHPRDLVEVGLLAAAEAQQELG
jgi:hypothetical protein